MVTVYTHSFAIDESVANEGTFASWTILLLCCMIKVQQLGQYKNR